MDTEEVYIFTAIVALTALMVYISWRAFRAYATFAISNKAAKTDYRLILAITAFACVPAGIIAAFALEEPMWSALSVVGLIFFMAG